MDPSKPLGSRDALILVDVQQDFCPGGSLPIEQGHDVVPILNRWIEDAIQAGAPVFASRDWHPAEHLSFHASGGPWPAHCIQDTQGAPFIRTFACQPTRSPSRRGITPTRINIRPSMIPTWPTLYGSVGSSVFGSAVSPRMCAFERQPLTRSGQGLRPTLSLRRPG